MRRDIDEALRGWPYDSGSNEVAAREVRARDGRTVVQIRIDLGLMQMELDGRPDGARPRGFTTYLDFLRQRSRQRKRRKNPGPIEGLEASWAMSPEHCAEADRELVQYYHRRIAMLSLQQYDRALRDAEHSLAMMDFIADHAPDLDYVVRHERLRAGVIFDHTQAAAAMALERCEPEEAVDAIRAGVDQLERHQVDLRELDDPDLFDPEGGPDDDSAAALLERLRRLEIEIRRHFDVPKTLREQLDEAVEREDYEHAARLRDQIRDRGD